MNMNSDFHFQNIFFTFFSLGCIFGILYMVYKGIKDIKEVIEHYKDCKRELMARLWRNKNHKRVRECNKKGIKVTLVEQIEDFLYPVDFEDEEYKRMFNDARNDARKGLVYAVIIGLLLGCVGYVSVLIFFKNVGLI
ncbi:MAG: hypothetical protein AB1465_04660 [Patescibacteria group bacterium]